jgi:hypothetical protein
LIDRYETGGRHEAMLRFGPAGGSVAVMALPLFEDANRVRALAAALCRALARRGIATVLPDLPGQGESLLPLERCTLRTIAAGLEDATKADRDAGRRVYGVALRSGALLESFARLDGRWRLAPQDGPNLLRDLKRIKQAAVGPAKRLSDLWYVDDGGATVEVAGNHPPVSLLVALAQAACATDTSPIRCLRLDTDPKPADRHVPGSPLWRRAEPDNDLALAAVLADDIADWIAACDG